MNRNLFWRFIFFVVLPLVLAAKFMYPPTPRDLFQEFNRRAVARDAAFKDIVQKAQELEKAQPGAAYIHLQEAIGTNDVTRYFPFFDAKNEVHPTVYILNRLQRDGAGKIRLGLDLQGGTSFLVEVQTNRLDATQNTEAALSQAVEVLRKRVDKFGVAEPVIQPEGKNRIRIQLPGLSQAERERAKITIQKVAFLEFKLVHPESRKLLESGELVPGYEVLTHVKELPNGVKQAEKYLVKKKAEMVGGIKSAMVTRDNMGRPEIAFTLDSTAKDTFGGITTAHVKEQLAIVLDGELQTAPVIQNPITGGNGQITGDYTLQEAFTLQNVLENPLRTPVRIVDTREVDPTLGKDSIKSGIKASVVGVISVSAFMLIYYMLAGLVANIALILNIVILMGVMCAVGTTLTLPGIAGVVLTVGMAVDANVLIFERIREEMAKGKSLRGALNAGYARAFGTIFDSHVTTLISSILLILLGTGAVKGFGVTLTIGVAASLFTALVVTRLIFDFLLEKNLIKSIRMLHLIRNPKIDFMKWAIPAFVASWALILIGNSYGIFFRGHEVLGVEFAGGETITLSFDPRSTVGVDKVREVASKASGGEVMVGYQRDMSSGSTTLRITTRIKPGAQAEGVSAKVVSALREQFPDAKYNVLSTDTVGATVGKEIQRTAILASLMAMFGILVYVAFRYEFSFAVGAVVAIIHDVLMTLGWYFLSGRELNATTVAAVLTIIGFSINDTIVIFDRIREDLKMGVRGTFREIMNQALNQTLSRTIITSGTVFLATLSLYIFGGPVINDFAFTFLVGILTGTYSSIYIASALVLWWHKGHRPQIGAGPIAAEAVAAARG
jgi:SecD/SecF fusion protein